jgi:tRNA A-37 threonylcarbamoyl transferase component Bud32
MDILNNDDALLPEVVLLTLLELLNSLVYYSVENSEAIIGRNGIMVLARALTRGEFAQYNHVSSVLQLMGELVLAVSDTKDEIREQHLIPVVVEMISSTKQATRIQAGQLLSVISGKNEKNCIAICQNAGIEGLVDLMIEQSMEARKYATCAIANITEMIPDMDAYLNKCRGIERLIVRLMDDDEATAIAVANALIELIKTKSGIKRLVYQNGGAQLFGYMLTQPKITFHRLAILGLESLEGVCEESIISDDANLDKAELTTINSEDLIYNAENLLGRGGFSEVLQGQWLGAPVAVKRYINTVKQERVKACEREAEILEQLRHPYILTYYGACAVESLLVTQFIERGSLYRVLHESEDQLSESWNLRIAIQIAQGLRYIHSKNFIHCDVKSANILLDHGDVPLFCDFGLSMLRTAMFMRSKEGVRGTPPWSAPESFSGIYTQACDVFSLGVLFYEIKARRKPSVLEFSILGARPAIPETTRQPFLALISQCWDRMPHNRPTMARVIEELTTHR